MKQTLTLSDHPFAIGNALLRRHRRAVARRRRAERWHRFLFALPGRLEVAVICVLAALTGWGVAAWSDLIGRAAAVLFASFCP